MEIDRMLAADAPPIMAILRGVKPEEAVAIAAALVDAGIRLIEVPLNSPDPFASIRRLQEAFGPVACIGAGTVVTAESVEALAATGATLMVSPNTDPALIALARARPAAHPRLPDPARGLRRDRRGGVGSVCH